MTAEPPADVAADLGKWAVIHKPGGATRVPPCGLKMPQESWDEEEWLQSSDTPAHMRFVAS